MTKYDIVDNFQEIRAIPCDLLVGDLDNVKDPFFSVVIPTFGRPELLKNCIMSAVEQEDLDVPYEIIVVDNQAVPGVNDTELMVRDLHIPNLYYYKNQINIGGAGNWNRCIMVARAKWVIMCHDDDWLKKNCLSVMKRIIEKHSGDRQEIGYIRSSAESWYDPKLKVLAPQKRRRSGGKAPAAVIKKNYWDVIWGGGATWSGAPTCGTLLNKDAVLSVGGYNKELAPCCDCYVPFHMLGKYAVYKTYYSYGYYRWSENDTYRKTTLLGLIAAYNEFLQILSEKHRIVRFFSDEHYADCVMYYSGKGKEADIVITEDEIAAIRPLKYSKVKLKILYICRKLNSGSKRLLAR